jgi:hypothetical protein
VHSIEIFPFSINLFHGRFTENGMDKRKRHKDFFLEPSNIHGAGNENECL